ncbi:MAG: N-acetyltransferase [Atribacterota bacterium]|nr:N-acetyltransferase [Atribacterota bacterium]
MIRKFKMSDMEEILNIWLKASIESHYFIEKEYWIDKKSAMKDIYIPNSETYVHESNGQIDGFISLCEDILAAIFVHPEQQGRGIGKKLLKKAMDLRENLSLSVYKENYKSVAFYEKAGFYFVKEKIDSNTGRQEIIMCWSAKRSRRHQN